MTFNATKKSQKFRLRTTLVLPFVLQIVAAVGLVGWLSFLNGQRAVKDLVEQLQSSTAKRIEQHLHAYLEDSQTLNRVHVVNVETGKLDPDDFQDLQHYFWSQLKVQKQSDYFIYANRSGFSLGVERIKGDNFVVKVRDSETAPNRVVYPLDSQGKRIKKVLESKPFDPRKRPFYQAALARSVWSPIYVSFSRRVLRLDAITPIYTKTGEFRGVFSTEVTLAQINEFLNQLAISPLGETFIVDRSGEIVASSTAELPFIQDKAGERRLLAQNSQEPIIRSTSRKLLQKFQNFQQIQSKRYFSFSFNGQRQLGYVLPFQDGRGLDWLIVIVVPEADFMGRINQNNRNSLLSCLAALAIAIAMGIFTARQVTRPILRVSGASERIARGELDQQIESSNIVEINTLSSAFNRMAGQIHESFQNLEEKEERFRTLAANIPGVTYRCLCDANWTMQYISDVIEDLSGYPAEDFIQGTRTFTSIIYPEDRERVAREIDEAVALNQPYILEYRLLHRDGSIHWIDERGRATLNDQGKVLFLDGAIFDITPQKLAEESLRLAEEKYRGIFENALEGIFQSSADGRLISANPAMAKIFGYESPQEMIEAITDIKEQIYVDPEACEQMFLKIEKQGQVDDFEFRAYQRDGDIIWIEIDARLVRDSNDRILYYEGIIQDITDRKRREESLKRQLEELKIEIDHQKRQKDVALITESGYFQEIQEEIEQVNLDEFWS